MIFRRSKWAAMGIVAAGILLLAKAPAMGAFVTPTSFNVGQAGGYSLLSMGTTVNSLPNHIAVKGNAGLGPGGSMYMSDEATITGSLTKHSDTVVMLHNGSAIIGGQVVDNAAVAAAIADANLASVAFAAATPTSTQSGINLWGNLNHTLTASVAGTNIFDITGGINLSNNSTLTLFGSATDYFIVNIDGALNMSGNTAIVLSGGITADQVLFNILASGSALNMSNNTVGYGTFLLPNGSASLSNDVVIHGALLSGGSNISLSNKATINGEENVIAAPGSGAPPGAGAVPEAGAFAIWSLLLGSAGFVAWRRRRAANK